jgi:hypothetical protein
MVQLKLSLCLASTTPSRHGVDAQIHVFYTSEQVGGEWSVSRPGRFTPKEEAPVTNG